MIAQPKIVHVSPNLAKLIEPYTVRLWPFVITISAGFVFDGASIPALAQPLVGGPYDPRRLPAAAVHDWLYASHRLPRWLADLVFLVILIRTGLLEIWRCLVDWWAVARFGRAAWDSHGPEEQAAALKQCSISIKGQIK
mgnify:CR=1 FL=1